MSVALIVMNVNKFVVTPMAATSACVIQAMHSLEMDKVVMVNNVSFSHVVAT